MGRRQYPRGLGVERWCHGFGRASSSSSSQDHSVVSQKLPEVLAQSPTCIGKASTTTLSRNLIMIDAYAQCGHSRECLGLYKTMLSLGPHPPKATLLSALSASANARDLAEGENILALIRLHLPETLSSDIAFNNAMLNLYGKCGKPEEARMIFDKMHGGCGGLKPTLVSWNAMVDAYARNGHMRDALILLQKMRLEGPKPDRITFLNIVNACASLEDCRAIHKCIVDCGKKLDRMLGTALLSKYGKWGSLDAAWLIFNGICPCDVITWTTMIDAFAQNGHPKKGLELFERMLWEGFKPDRVTYLSVLKSCAELASLQKGRRIHDLILINKFDFDVVIMTSLLNMYAKCSSLLEARMVFDGLYRRRNVFTWTAMISAYAQNGRAKEALELYQEMQLEGVNPDKITFLSVLLACASLESPRIALPIHQQIIANNLESDITIATALINTYGKCGCLCKAREVFDGLPYRDIIAWSAMIAAYAENGCGKEALELFHRMKMERVKPAIATFLSALDACTSLPSLEKGREIHEYVIASGFSSNIAITTALLHMYGKCGSLKKAREVFDGMHSKDQVLWTAILSMYAHHGNCRETMRLFCQMLWEEGAGVKPNKVTFVAILNACSHGGLSEEGWKHFVSMNDYGVLPSMEHFACMVDLFGRVGFLEGAEELTKNMPCQPDATTWASLLGSCRIHGDM